MNYDTLRSQHKALIGLVAELKKLTNGHPSEDNLEEIGQLLSLLTEKLQSHFILEDRIVYPTLLSIDDKEIHETTIAFQRSISDLADVYMGFVMKWDSGSIEESYSEFSQEAQGIFEAVLNRIHREDELLFPYLEEVLKE